MVSQYTAVSGGNCHGIVSVDIDRGEWLLCSIALTCSFQKAPPADSMAESLLCGPPDPLAYHSALSAPLPRAPRNAVPVISVFCGGPIKVAIINAYHHSPFDDLFHLSPIRNGITALTNVVSNIVSPKHAKAMVPLALPALAALTPDDWEREVYDEQIEPAPPEVNADVVGFDHNAAGSMESLLNRDWPRYNFTRAVITPLNMSAGQLQMSLRTIGMKSL